MMTDEAKPEIFIMVDTEYSGPVPGVYSLLSLGAVVVGKHTPPFAKTFYIEFQPLAGGLVDPEAMAYSRLDIERLKQEGKTPLDALAKFVGWLSVVAPNHVTRPVMVSQGVCDHMFVQWYLYKFLGSSPFWHRANSGINGIDMKSFYMGRYNVPNFSQTKARSMRLAVPAPDNTDNHHALADAIHQAALFDSMLKGLRK
jgi:DNA polymerase III epsilon subunit-like protein